MNEEPTSTPPPSPTTITSQPTKQSGASDLWNFTAELVKTAIIVSLLAYALRIFVLQPFIVEGSSMAPNFHTNDYLLVDKVSYHFHQPARGDVIVFRVPFTDANVDYVKRIIGLPGEHIRIENGNVFVINSDHPDGVKIDETYLAPGTKTSLDSGATKAEFVVPDNNYFVMGDNRPASSDSRSWGFLPQDHIIGRVALQAFPLNQAHFVSGVSYQNAN